MKLLRDGVHLLHPPFQRRRYYSTYIVTMHTYMTVHVDHTPMCHRAS